jgi:3-oxoacyl-[acyl-carrier protein] reductase
MGRLAGKVALVTGAAQGIGEATARLLASEGARVACADMNIEGAKEVASTIDGIALSGDVTDPAVPQAWVSRITENWDRLDVLVNNAGITRDAIAAKMTLDQWNAVLAVNLTGSFLCAQAAVAVMREQGSGAIVNTSSASALGNVGQANYAAAKAGVIGLTRTLALEAARYGIRVNAVAPGFVDTAMTRTVPEHIRETMISRIPLKRTAEPVDVARVHLFLVSDDSAYLTGQFIGIDGGLTISAAGLG